MSKHFKIIKSFGFALDGLETAFKQEFNFKIHIIIAFAAIITAYFIGFSILEWAILFFTIFLVFIMETLNTTIEALVDLISPEYNAKAKIVKDVSAAGVFLSAILALIIGVLLFVPKIF